VIFDAPYNSEIAVPRMHAWSDWKQILESFFGEVPKIDPYALQYGEKVAGKESPVSPRARRNNQRLSTNWNTARYKQHCLLGTLDSEPLSPEDVAAIKGSGSLYDDNGVLDSLTLKCETGPKKYLPSMEVISEAEGAAAMRKRFSETKRAEKSEKAESTANALFSPTTSAAHEALKERARLEADTARPKMKGDDRFGGDDDYTSYFQPNMGKELPEKVEL
jgi:hypothetical protein